MAVQAHTRTSQLLLRQEEGRPGRLHLEVDIPDKHVVLETRNGDQQEALICLEWPEFLWLVAETQMLMNKQPPTVNNGEATVRLKTEAQLKHEGWTMEEIRAFSAIGLVLADEED